MPHQDALTVAAKVVPSKLPGVTQLQQELRTSPGHNAVLPFARIPSLHFGRIVLLPASDSPSGERVPAELLLVTDCDGSADHHLNALVQAAGAGLDRLFGHCEDYPQGRI